MSSFGLRVINDSGEYLISEQTTTLAFVKKCIGFDSAIRTEFNDFGKGQAFRYLIQDCPGVPIPFFTAPIEGKLYAVTQVFPTGNDNEWQIELITNSAAEDAPNFSSPSNVAVPPTGFSMTLDKDFDPEWWQTPIFPVTTSGTIANVTVVPKNYDPSQGVASAKSKGLTRGTYICCHDTGTYNTSTNTLTNFTQDYIPEDREIKFGNIMKAGDDVAYKERSFAGNWQAVFQYNGGNTQDGGTSSNNFGNDVTSVPSTAPLLGGNQLRIWNKRAEDYYHFFRNNFSGQLDIIASEYFSSTNRTHIYLSRGDYTKVIVGQYINFPQSDGFGGISRSGWKEILAKVNTTDNGRASYYVQIAGNHQVKPIDEITFKHRNESAEKIADPGAANSVYNDFYMYVRGWPNVSVTSSNADSNGHFQLSSDYTECNTSFYAMHMDGGETERRSSRGYLFTRGFPSDEHAHLTPGNIATKPSPDDIWDYYDTDDYRPQLGYKPPIESGMGYQLSSLPRVQVLVYLYANLFSTRHYLKNHTMNREAIIKGPQNFVTVNQGDTGGLMLDEHRTNSTLPSLSDQNTKNSVTVTDVPANYVMFSHSLSFTKTLTESDIAGYPINGKWENPPANGAMTKNNGIKFFFNQQYLTYSHGTAANSLADNTFSFESAEIRTGHTTSNTQSPVVAESDSFTIPLPATNSLDSQEAKIDAVTNNSWSYTGSSPQLCIHYTFNVKVAGIAVTTKKVLICVKAPTTKSCKLLANFNFYHQTVTKTYPFTSFIFPTAQASLVGSTDGITGARTWKLYQKKNEIGRLDGGSTPTDFTDGSTLQNTWTLLAQATTSTNTASYNYDPFTNTSWHDSTILLQGGFDRTQFMLIVEQSGVEVARSFHTHYHSETHKEAVYLTKYFNVKPWMSPDDESMWRHDGFVATPNTLQTFNRGFVPGVACVNGVIDNIDGMNIQPYYIRTAMDSSDATSDADQLNTTRAFRTQYGNPHPTQYDCHENLIQMSYFPLQQPLSAYLATNNNRGSLQSAYSNYSSRKWTFDYCTYNFTSTRPDQVTLSSSTRGLLRANYGHLNAGQTIKEQLIWKGQVVTSSATIGGITNPVTVGNYTYSFDFANTTYTPHFTFVPVNKEGPYDANDFDGYGPNQYGAETIPELYIFSDPSSAPTPFDPEGLQVRDNNGTTLFDSRIRPLLVHSTADVTQPATPTTLNCASLPANSKNGFTSHESVFNPTNNSTITLSTTSNPAFFYNVKTQAHLDCLREKTTTDNYVLYSQTRYHSTHYWCLYKGGIGRNSGNTTINSGYIVVDQGAYYQNRYTSGYVLGLVTKTKKNRKGFLGLNNETVNNTAQTVISIDTSVYQGSTYTVTTSAGTGTDIKLSGSDRNGSFNNVVAKTLTLRTGDRLKITFHTANYSIKTAGVFVTGFDANPAQTVGNDGTLSEVHFVPDKVGSYFYTKLGISATNSFGEIVVTAA